MPYVIERPSPVPAPTSLVVKNGSKMRDDLRRLADLVHGAAQLVQHAPAIRDAELEVIDRVADEEADVVQGVVQLVRDAGGEFADRGELASLDELLLLLMQLRLTALAVHGGLSQVA